MKNCFGLGIVVIAMLGAVVACEAWIIQLGWNYVLVDTAGVNVNHLPYKAAIVLAIVLTVIGGMFGGSASSSK
jgi:hypothetical protein